MNILRSTIRIFICLLFIALICLLAIMITNRSKQSPDMYTRAGVFDIKYGNKLQINNINGYISYMILDSEGNDLISASSNFTDAERWYFVSDTNGSVWIHSSDVGDFIYKRTPENTFDRENITAELCTTSPASFKENLPSSLKNLWNCNITDRKSLSNGDIQQSTHDI
ncbi:MAG: hypothetical protein M1459_00245 [Patescibacteria group bacterium]|nr:hypothetical protein [Patescibacteria group bacterium]